MPGGKRPGAGRPRASTVKKMYKLAPDTIEKVKTIALGFDCTESAIAEQALRWYIPTKLEQARRRLKKAQ
jgi:predicted transcriptional regulator